MRNTGIELSQNFSEGDLKLMPADISTYLSGD